MFVRVRPSGTASRQDAPFFVPTGSGSFDLTLIIYY